MGRWLSATLVGCTLMTALGGCSAPIAAPTAVTSIAPRPGLVLGPSGPIGPEDGRNDPRMGRLPRPAQDLAIVEITGRQRLRVSNGRPREVSTYETRTFLLRSR